MSDAVWKLVCDDHCSIELKSQNDAAVLADALRDADEWLDVVCGRRTVYVQFDLVQKSAEQALSKLAAFERPMIRRQSRAEPIDIPACYDPKVAPDSLETCQRLDMSHDALVHAHVKAVHEVAMLGFMPGFAYIDGLDPTLQTTRLDQPRQNVAAGSIGIAGSQTGIYPFDGPGGWRLIARTPLKLFHPTATPPALLSPMQQVRFVPITLAELESMS